MQKINTEVVRTIIKKERVMIYAYMAKGINRAQEIKLAIELYARSHGLPLTAIIQDPAAQELAWQDRLLSALYKELNQADSLIIYDAAELGPNFEAVAEFLGAVVDKGLMVHFIKYDKIFYGEKIQSAAELIDLFRHIECDFIAKAAISHQQNLFYRKNKAAKL
jgi:hypothetical protein